VQSFGCNDEYALGRTCVALNIEDEDIPNLKGASRLRTLVLPGAKMCSGRSGLVWTNQSESDLQK